jgi:hypothetical protein
MLCDGCVRAFETYAPFSLQPGLGFRTARPHATASRDPSESRLASCESRHQQGGSGALWLRATDPKPEASYGAQAIDQPDFG